MKVVFTALADRQLTRLHDHIGAQAGVVTADRYVERIVSFCQSLATFPARGTRRDDILPGLRTIGFERRITIALLVETETVLIEGVFYGGQDVDAALLAGHRGPP